MEESFWGSVKIMLFVYALAAVVSFFMAGVIKGIYSGISMRKARAEARSQRAEARAKAGAATTQGGD